MRDWKVGGPEHVELWDAINEYVRTCRGDPSRYVYGNTSRMDATVRVENAVRKLTKPREGGSA